MSPELPGSPHAKDLALPALRERFVASGLPRYRADQWAGWVYGRGVRDYDAMTDLPAELRARLAEWWPLDVLEVVDVQVSNDGTRKGRLRTHDGHAIESVLIPEEARQTLCISTQVGCPLACSFCATGAMGFTRNLRTSEIVDQVCRMQAVAGSPITNVVYAYDTGAATPSWVAVASMGWSRSHFAMAQVGTLIYATGGTGSEAKKVESYDPVANTWTEAPHLDDSSNWVTLGTSTAAPGDIGHDPKYSSAVAIGSLLYLIGCHHGSRAASVLVC